MYLHYTAKLTFFRLLLVNSRPVVEYAMRKKNSWKYKLSYKPIKQRCSSKSNNLLFYVFMVVAQC